MWTTQDRQDGGNYRRDNKHYLLQKAGNRLAHGSSWPRTLGRSDFSLWRKKGEVKLGPIGGVCMDLEILSWKFKIFLTVFFYCKTESFYHDKKSLNSASYD